jgi:GxxExxY protein
MGSGDPVSTMTRRFEDTKGEGDDRGDDPAERASHRVIGAAIEVHRAIGPGFVESVYQKALAIELTLRGIRFEPQHRFELEYKGHAAGTGRVDFLIEECLIVEIKAVEAIIAVHQGQTLSYLRAKQLHLGLLVNFNVARLVDGVKRVVL